MAKRNRFPNSHVHRGSSFNKQLRIILCLILALSLGFALSCAKPRPHRPPITIGMAKADVVRYYPFISDEFNLMTHPSEFRPAYHILRDGVRLTLAFDEDDRIHSLSTSDESFRLPSGIGVASTFAEMRRHYKDYEIFPVLGYGRMVRVDTATYLGFPWKDRDELDIDDNEKVVWVEFKEWKEEDRIQ